MNKKGSIFDILTWIILAFIVIFFLGIWLYANDLLTNTLTQVPSIYIGANNTQINVSQAFSQTLGVVNTAEQKWLPILAFIIIVCEALTIMISNFFIKEHPVMFIPYIFIIVIAVVVAAQLSNTYVSFLSGNPFSTYLTNMTMGNYIMIYLPYWTAVIGAIGAILLMAQITTPNMSGGASA